MAPRAGAAPRVYDTYSRSTVPLPVRVGPGGPEMSVYVCGVTPYDTGHLGHAFTFLTFDVLVRYAESRGVKVTYVQNVTDVDDPLFERARRDGGDWKDLATEQQAKFVHDMGLLGWRPPDRMPRVSEEIPGIIESCRELAAAGYAYRAEGNLYFEAARFPSFGALSQRTRRSMLLKLKADGLLGEAGSDARRDALDFVLWRPSAPGEPAWQTPFGPGRPGWHIECSTMAMRYLGPQVDVHGGGRDLIFSHHESERAQSEAITGMPFVRAWMHSGMVRYEGHKMSKSLGNLVLVPQTLERVSPAAVRIFLASHHYRTDWTFSWPALEAAGRLADRARKVIEGGSVRGPGRPADAGLLGEFDAALADDLDSPRAVRALRRAVSAGDAGATSEMLQILAGDASLDRIR